jgi:hypothetical protein
LFQAAGILLMARGLLLLATGSCAVGNYLIPTPLSDAVGQVLGIALRGYPLMTPASVQEYVTPAAIAIMTLLIAGIPAALYERIRGLKASTPVSLGIWLVAAILLTLPTVLRAFSDEYGG